MPLVQPATLLAVARALDHHAVAYAQYRGRRGHPVGFAAELYSELTELSGDEGARRIIARYPAFAGRPRRSRASWSTSTPKTTSTRCAGSFAEPPARDPAASAIAPI